MCKVSLWAWQTSCVEKHMIVPECWRKKSLERQKSKLSAVSDHSQGVFFSIGSIPESWSRTERSHSRMNNQIGVAWLRIQDNTRESFNKGKWKNICRKTIPTQRENKSISMKFFKVLPLGEKKKNLQTPRVQKERDKNELGDAPGWLSWLSDCLLLRSWSQGPRIEPHMQLSRESASACPSASPPHPTHAHSLSNK